MLELVWMRACWSTPGIGPNHVPSENLEGFDLGIAPGSGHLNDSVDQLSSWNPLQHRLLPLDNQALGSKISAEHGMLAYRSVNQKCATIPSAEREQNLGYEASNPDHSTLNLG